MIDSGEVAVRSRQDRRTDLDDPDLAHRVARYRVRRAAATESDMDDTGVVVVPEEERQMPLQLLHGVEVRTGPGDVDAVELERDVVAVGVVFVAHGDRRIGVLLEVEKIARTVAREEARSEDHAIRRQKRSRQDECRHDEPGRDRETTVPRDEGGVARRAAGQPDGNEGVGRADCEEGVLAAEERDQEEAGSQRADDRPCRVGSGTAFRRRRRVS
ncbi:MAG: hypothetical protein R2862_06130 [Thermoanaerobaculia bacterium]